MKETLNFEDRAGLNLLFQIKDTELISFALWDEVNNRVYLPDQISPTASSLFV